MNQSGVNLLLERLAKYGQLVDAAYYKGKLTKTADNVKGIELLQQYKVLVPRGDDTYTLNTTLRHFFDSSLNVERLYGLSTDIGSMFKRMDNLIDALFEVAHEGQMEDRGRLEDEVFQSIYEISDNLAAELAHLRTMVENRFGNVHTLAEKKRQNAYYIDRTEKLVRAIELFTLSSLGERIQTQGVFVNIAPMFQTQLIDRLPSFRQNLSDILVILKRYLFEFRKIEERTRRIRSLWLYLERHPDYEFQDWDKKPTPPRWLWKAKGIPIKAYPQVRNPEYTDTLAALASKIAPPKVRTPVVRPRGALDNDEPVPAVVIPIKSYQKEIESLVAACKDRHARVSALQWYTDNRSHFSGISGSIWLQYVLEYLGPRKKKNLGITVVAAELQDTIFTGNAVISDVQVGPE